MASQSGQCLCGAVKFTAETVQTSHHVCHCGMCRRWTGGPLFAAIAKGVTFEGEDNIGTYASSDWADRGFCKICGTNLFYRIKQTGMYVMSVGAFDDPAPFKLAHEIYIDHKPDGYDFAGNLPKLTEAEFIAKFAPPAS